MSSSHITELALPQTGSSLHLVSKGCEGITLHGGRALNTIISRYRMPTCVEIITVNCDTIAIYRSIDGASDHLCSIVY